MLYGHRFGLDMSPCVANVMVDPLRRRCRDTLQGHPWGLGTYHFRLTLPPTRPPFMMRPYLEDNGQLAPPTVSCFEACY